MAYFVGVGGGGMIVCGTCRCDSIARGEVAPDEFVVTTQHGTCGACGGNA